MKFKIKEITLIAILSAILFIQKEILSYLPNISLSMLLIFIYSKKLGLYKTSLIVMIFVLFDNILLNSFNIIFTPFVLFGWLIIPVLICTVFKNINQCFYLSILGIFFSFLYSWIFFIPNILILDINIKIYFINDLPFEILFAVTNFISILFLYKPCSKAFDFLIKY